MALQWRYKGRVHSPKFIAIVLVKARILKIEAHYQNFSFRTDNFFEFHQKSQEL